VYQSTSRLDQPSPINPAASSHRIPTLGDSGDLQTHVSPRVPQPKVLRDRLQAIAADVAAAWRADRLPAEVATPEGLRRAAEEVAVRGGGRPEHVGWVMVALVTAYWRDRLAEPGGRRLLLLPDCQHAQPGLEGPVTCGPQCVYATLASAAADSGWQVASTRDAAASIAGALGGIYQAVLGVASLDDLEKAYSLIPPFAMPIAAVPVVDGPPVGADSIPVGSERRRVCRVEQIDAEWVLGLLGVAGGSVSPVADHLPLLRESAEMFTPDSLGELFGQLGLDAAAEAAAFRNASPAAVHVTDRLGVDFLARGGKFLRPFMALAAFDAVAADCESKRVVPAFSGGERRQAEAAATAIEVFHKASLVHDDIEDDDAMRYGRPTMHRECGVPAAINAGDYLIGLGYRIIASVEKLSAVPERDPSLQRDLLAILSRAHLELARGQGAELWWRDAAEKRLSPEEALEIYGLKTSPAFAAAFEMGVRLAGCDPRQAGSLTDYATHVGIAFQVLNDLKDWRGDLENLRQAAGDLLGGRPTVLWAVAVQRLGETDRARLMELSRPVRGATAEQQAQRLVEARSLYAKAGVFACAREMILEHRSKALSAAATCRMTALRDVLEFILDLAVPEQALPAA
jgi:geranylgeranyl pyrophosphate synthase